MRGGWRHGGEEGVRWENGECGSGLRWGDVWKMLMLTVAAAAAAAEQPSVGEFPSCCIMLGANSCHIHICLTPKWESICCICCYSYWYLPQNVTQELSPLSHFTLAIPLCDIIPLCRVCTQFHFISWASFRKNKKKQTRLLPGIFLYSRQ